MTEIQEKQITDDEWTDVLGELQSRHTIFGTLAKIGKPTLTKLTPTAEVMFSMETGKLAGFLFNPDFWDSLSVKQRAFVISHEALHIIFNHGYRIVAGSKNVARQWSLSEEQVEQVYNICADMIINTWLIKLFNFKKEEAPDHENIHWLPDKYDIHKVTLESLVMDFLRQNRNKMEDSSSESMKTVAGILSGKPGDGKPENGNGKKQYTIDNHDKLKQNIKSEEIIEAASKELSEEEKDEMWQEGSAPNCGDQPMGAIFDCNIGRVRIKRTWEKAIYDFFKYKVRYTNDKTLQWVKVNRRFSAFLDDFPNLKLPTKNNRWDKQLSRNSLDIWAFLDISGSCIHEKDRFLRAAKSFPFHKFNIIGHTFDTQVYRIPDVRKTNQIRGGGGTCFQAIENFIQSKTGGNKNKYPDAVWIITDGEAHLPTIQLPNKWYWFINHDHIQTIRGNIPRQCKIFHLDDFE